MAPKMRVDILGSVEIAGRSVSLNFEVPAAAASASTSTPATMSPPSTKDIILQMMQGKLLYHPTKQTVTAQELGQRIHSIQSQLSLTRGLTHGQWSDEAQTRLCAWLLAPRKNNKALADGKPSGHSGEQAALTDGREHEDKRTSRSRSRSWSSSSSSISSSSASSSSSSAHGSPSVAAAPVSRHNVAERQAKRASSAAVAPAPTRKELEAEIEENLFFCRLHHGTRLQPSRAQAWQGLPGAEEAWFCEAERVEEGTLRTGSGCLAVCSR